MIQGVKFEVKLEPEPGLEWKMIWPGLDPYGQKVIGRTLVNINVGYQFSDCPYIRWDTKVSQLYGYHGIDNGHFYGWTLNWHHQLDPRSMILYHGW